MIAAIVSTNSLARCLPAALAVQLARTEPCGGAGCGLISSQEEQCNVDSQNLRGNWGSSFVICQPAQARPDGCVAGWLNPPLPNKVS